MLEVLHCLSCGKVLGEAEISEGILERKCPRCKSVTRWEFVTRLQLFSWGIIKHRQVKTVVNPSSLPKILN